ncbi:MAG: hypothetical protein HN986_02445 [Candidatus Marinimicrobia bacterium]|nr:hypothetical protein [Candidatus Neomarinimicrobiota bacterium]
MKIIDIREMVVVKVSTDESEYNEYTRYGADDWYVTMREGDVQMFDSHELEFLYQNYITKK